MIARQGGVKLMDFGIARDRSFEDPHGGRHRPPSPSDLRATLRDVTQTKPKFSLPLAGRTFARRQGCWNCSQLASPESSLQHWLTSERPQHEARIAEGKRMVLDGAQANPAALQRFANTNVNDRCPCGSGQKYKRCHRRDDEDAARVFKQIEGIEKATEHLERFEASIRVGDPILGQMALCNEKSSTKYGTFVSDKYLCDRWTAAQGASIARGGARADDVPEEMVERHGDGN